jgi:hypothetical protein
LGSLCNRFFHRIRIKVLDFLGFSDFPELFSCRTQSDEVDNRGSKQASQMVKTISFIGSSGNEDYFFPAVGFERYLEALGGGGFGVVYVDHPIFYCYEFKSVRESADISEIQSGPFGTDFELIRNTCCSEKIHGVERPFELGL